jgi:branched-chain amino acid transport system substrate-binding protein
MSDESGERRKEKMEGRGKVFVWGMALALVFTLLATQSIVFGFSEPVRIGTIFPRSGFLADLGIESWRGAEIARLERNEKGGIGGQKIIYVDTDAPNVDAAVSNAESLINREKVKVICGTYWSSGGYAASAVAEKNKT